MSLSTTSRIVGDAVVLGLDGIADLSTAPVLQDALQRLIAQHAGGRVVVDLDGPLSIDDVAFGLLLGAAASARMAGGDLEVVATHPPLRERLASTGFDRAVAVRTSVADTAAATEAAGPDPAPGTPPGSYVAVIFTNLRNDADDEGYAATAGQMEALAAAQPGYLGIESVRGTDGAGITVSYWASEHDARAWKAQAEHLEAQRLGRERWYASYTTRIAIVVREYSYRADPS